ncbi:MAG: hypothetical protein RH860_06905 [Cytophagales bacterium]
MIAKFLRQYLAHNDQAYIPKLGTFYAKNLKADVDPSKKEMKPPVRTVSFKQESSKDNSFIDFLARVDGKSIDAIKKDLSKWVDELKKEIVAKKKVELDGLGHLGVNSAKKVVFKALPDLNISPDTLGMQKVKAEPIGKKASPKTEESKEKPIEEKSKGDLPKEDKKEDKKEVAAPIAEAAKDAKSALKDTPKAVENKFLKKEEKKRNPIVLVLLILVILVAASGIGYYFLSQHEEPVVVEKPEPVQEREPEPEPEPEPITEPEPEPKPVITISEKNGRFYVIGNSFEIEANAYKYRENVMAKGQSDSKIILPDNKSRLYRVSIAEAETIEGAIGKMEDLRSEFGNTIWVLIY